MPNCDPTPGDDVTDAAPHPSERHAGLEHSGSRAAPAGRRTRMAAEPARLLPGPGARDRGAPSRGLAVSRPAGAARAPAEPVSRRGGELGAPPSAALPAPDAVGQAHRWVPAIAVYPLTTHLGTQSPRFLRDLVAFTPSVSWAPKRAQKKKIIHAIVF
jgi:hypothetical protein